MKTKTSARLTSVIICSLSLTSLAGLKDSSISDTSDIETPKSVETRIGDFTQRYAPFFNSNNDLMSKIIDNRGNGYEPLYGLRNTRVVLHGVLYRGGANNAYHRSAPRNNMNPLPTDGLANLCKESFGEAIYLYPTNFTPQKISCTTRTDETNELIYTQTSVLNAAIPGEQFSEDFNANKSNEVRDILKKVHQCATGDGSCPIYAHCWNGWHASGFISALALRQFCDYTPAQAEQYWVDGTDSPSNSNYPFIKAAIRSFQPFSDMQISVLRKSKICPRGPYTF